jgi:hypothetical protein
MGATFRNAAAGQTEDEFEDFGTRRGRRMDRSIALRYRRNSISNDHSSSAITLELRFFISLPPNEKLSPLTTDNYPALARRRRSASTNCQAITPGIPNASSRTRRSSDRAKAMSPGMPTRLPRRMNPPSCTPTAPGTRNAALRTKSEVLSKMMAVVKFARKPSARSAIQISPEAISQDTIQKKQHVTTPDRRA